jgi:hypothetical protein
MPSSGYFWFAVLALVCGLATPGSDKPAKTPPAPQTVKPKVNLLALNTTLCLARQ